MKKVAIVIPTYNEKENISKLIEAILDLNIDKNKFDIYIIVVDDNSPDGTASEVEKLKNSKVKLIKRPTKLGLGTAHITGFLYAENIINADYIITMDADFSHAPRTIPTIIEKLLIYDVVIGSRYVTGSLVVDSPKFRKIISKTANFLTKNLLGLNINDATSGFRGYRSEILKRISYNKIFSDGYSFLVELIYKILKIEGIKICEIPITFFDRKKGKSKISKKEIFKAMKTILKLFLLNKLIDKESDELLDEETSIINPINYIRLKFHLTRYKKVKKLLKEGNILDIGCGRPSEFMKDMSFLIYIKNERGIGLDIKEIQTFNYSFVKASVHQTPFKEKEFDNITMMEVIEHLQNIEGALKEIKRILKDDGKLIISTPDANILWKSIWYILSKTISKVWQDKHLSNYTLKEWKKIISEHFKVVSVKRNFYFDLIFECVKK